MIDDVTPIIKKRDMDDYEWHRLLKEWNESMYTSNI